MTAGTQLDKILNPSFDNFLPGTFDDWLPEIHDADLREDMLKNPRFRDRLTAYAFRRHNVRVDLPLDDLAQADELACALQADPLDLIHKVGCVWHARSLAMAATQGKIADFIVDITMENIRWALAVATQPADRPIVDPADTAAQIIEDGRLCIEVWFDGLPAQLRARIALSCQLPSHLITANSKPTSLDTADADIRTSAVMACLTAMKSAPETA